jgi:hypothetical protein
MDVSRSPLATPVLVKTDIVCKERRNESVIGIEKVGKAEQKKMKNVRARRSIIFRMDYPKL